MGGKRFVWQDRCELGATGHHGDGDGEDRSEEERGARSEEEEKISIDLSGQQSPAMACNGEGI